MFANCFAKHILILFLFVFAIACNQQPGAVSNTAANANAVKDPLFKLLSPAQTNISFINTLNEDINANVMMYEYIYNGGGVAIANVNGDGLQDIYFTGN